VIDDKCDVLFHRQGFASFSYQREDQNDPQLLSQRWINSPSGGVYLVDEFFQRFGQNTFRKMLRHIYSSRDGVPRQDLISENSEKREAHLAYMCDQELAVDDGTVVSRARRFQHISDIGRTFEWYVSQCFQRILECPARYGVHVDGIAECGDLDVVAFMNDLRIWVECKSGRDITDKVLGLFLQRAQDFSPSLAVLLIDTDNNRSMDSYIDRLNKSLPDQDQFELKISREWLYFRGRGLYVVGVPNSIGESLHAVLRLYQDRVRYVPFIGSV
jgi:hypothetical protein